MRNFLSSERHKCLHLDDRVVKKVSKTNFGGITNKAICWGISAMLGISPMVGIWGAPHAPKSDATAIRENARAPIRKTQAIWGANPKPPISPMACIWELPKPQGVYGECPMPPSQTLPLFGRMPEPQSGRRKLFGSPQAPYLRWRVFGSCPSPRVFMGSAPCPQDRTLPLFGVPRSALPLRSAKNPTRDASYLGSQPQAPNISDGVYLGVAQAPRCIWGAPHTSNVRRCSYSGECPNPNQEDASSLGVPKPHIIFFHSFIFLFFQCYRTSTGTPRRSSDN